MYAVEAATIDIWLLTQKVFVLFSNSIQSDHYDSFAACMYANAPSAWGAGKCNWWAVMVLDYVTAPELYD